MAPRPRSRDSSSRIRPRTLDADGPAWARRPQSASGARGWSPISANFIHPKWVGTHWPMYCEGCERGGHAVRGEEWRVARSIFVADDEATARRYALAPDGAYGFYFWNLMAKRRARGALDTFKHDFAMPDADCTLEYVLNHLPIFGTPERVAEAIVELRRTAGPFGTLLYVGHDWADAALARRVALFCCALEVLLTFLMVFSATASQLASVLAARGEARPATRSSSDAGRPIHRSRPWGSARSSRSSTAPSGRPPPSGLARVRMSGSFSRM